MEMILRSAEVNTNEITGPSMNAFMNDETLVVKSSSHTEQLMIRLQELSKLAVMKIKPSKCRSLSIIKGNCREIKFSVDGNEIPTINKKKGKESRSLQLPTTYWSTLLAGPKQTAENWITLHW